MLLTILPTARGGSSSAPTTRAERDPCRPAPERIQDQPIGAPNLVETLPPGQLDSDGDSRADAVTTQPGTVTVVRGDGTLRFRQPGSEMTVQSWADLPPGSGIITSRTGTGWNLRTLRSSRSSERKACSPRTAETQ